LIVDNNDGTFSIKTTHSFEDVWTACGGCGQKVTGDSIHTCSPQRKPLSDEEIRDIWYQHEKWLATVPYSFVKAIEERHGIK
jgi:hypothetical protein